MINTSAYSYTAQAYGDNVQKYLSLLEGFVGVGITMGPILGSIVFEFLGFDKTFFIFGGLMAPSALFVFCFLPSPTEVKIRLAEHEAEDKTNETELLDLTTTREVPVEIEELDVLEKLSYRKLICEQRVLHAALSASVMYVAYGSLEPTLNLRLDEYGLN
jgi:MFS family permease